MSDGIAPAVNPATGNEGHSVETAAEDFTAFLADEGKAERPRRREKEEKPARQSPAPADAAATREAGQSERQPSGEREGGEDDDAGSDRDPVLDDGPLPEGEDDAEDKGDDEDGEDDQEGDDDQDDEDGDDADDPLDTEHEVKVNGETKKVTVREALASFQMEADYRQKTERNSREYEEIQDFAKGTVETRARTDATLLQAQDLIESLQIPQADWDALEASNPQGFIAAKKQWDGLLEKARGIHAARVQLAADAQAEQEQALQRFYAETERKLLQEYPALRDEKKANSFRQSVMAYGKSAGYSEQELIDGAVDARALITLYKAAMYDRTRASAKAAGKKATQAAPKNSAENRPQGPNRNESRKTRRAADRRLQQSGTLRDAAASFEAMIRAE